MEDKDKRSHRLESGTPVEIIDTLLNSLDNGFRRQITQAAQNNAWELVLIGIHSASTTIGCGLFSDSPLTGFTAFLREFVDDEKPGGDFSAIAKQIHDWRNVLVHRWLSQQGYSFGFDFEQQEGWRLIDDVTLLNPIRLHNAFSLAFSVNGKLWNWQQILSDLEKEQAKQRLLTQYHRN